MANDQDIALQQNPEALFPEVIEKLSYFFESILFLEVCYSISVYDFILICPRVAYSAV